MRTLLTLAIFMVLMLESTIVAQDAEVRKLSNPERVVIMKGDDMGVIHLAGETVEPTVDKYEVKSIWVETEFNNSKKSSGEDEKTGSRFLIIYSPDENTAFGNFWLNRTAAEIDALMSMYKHWKANNRKVYYFRDTSTVGPLGLYHVFSDNDDK